MAQGERTWLDFWNGEHRIYVNDRHREMHYGKLCRDILQLMPQPGLTMIDWGCGDALNADEIALRTGRLILCDGAEATRGRLETRFAGHPRIDVLSPEEIRALPAGIADVMLVNSVIQYLSPEVLKSLMADARHLLKPDGRFVIADVIPPDDDIVGDVLNLLTLGARHGFFLAALGGLAATFFSPYRKLRADLGLARYAEADMVRLFAEGGFTATRLKPNLGFDQRRMAFSAVPV